MSYGSLSLFYGGLESLLGPPKMVNGSLENGMAREHQGEADSKIGFSTSNGVTTVSEKEWEVVVSPIAEMTYPERDGLRETNPSWCRKYIGIEKMMERMEAECNSRLRKDGHSELIREELIGGRLYAACLTPCPRPPFSSSLEGGCTLPHTYTTPMRPPLPYS